MFATSLNWSEVPGHQQLRPAPQSLVYWEAYVCVVAVYGMARYVASVNPVSGTGQVIARPKSVLPKAARPKGGLFRYHVKRIHFTMQGFGFLSAIFRQNWWPCTTTMEVPPLFNLARFDQNKDCCWKNYLQTESDYFSHSICSFINCISIKITIQLNL